MPEYARLQMLNRTWPVFLIGLGSLLALLFVPGVTALRKTQEVYERFRSLQRAHQRTQASLNEIERRLYLNSILVRDFLLDSSPVASERYENDFVANRMAVQTELAALASVGRGAGAVQRLRAEFDAYFLSAEPLFEWTPEQRNQRATYFLREQQRPRRQSILAMASEISRLVAATYNEQYEQVNLSQLEFNRDMERVVALAFLIGVVIAGGSIFRIFSLEQKADRQRSKTERTEVELRHLSTQLMHAQEEERKAISRELHDEVGQTLTALRMQLGSLDRVREDVGHFQDHVAEAKSLAEQALRAIRDLAVGLRPSVLDLGLVPALQWQARHFSKHSGIPVRVEVEGEAQDVPEEHRTCVYRIVQETLTNCAKHANAQRAEVWVRVSDHVLVVQVTDDGSGFDAAAARGGGLGLIGVEERVRELGGTLRIESESGNGSALLVQLPIPRERSGAAA
jgi:signal transduction histidine kinase